MKAAKIFVVSLLAVIFLSGVGHSAGASEYWIVDSATGTKICILSTVDNLTLVSANWSGAAVGGLAEGQGKLQFVYREESGKESKVLVEAEMKAGKMDGRVSIKWPNADSYEGLYKAGQREGKGIFRYADGRSYDGEWKDGNQCGKGAFRWADGSSYEGDWQDGKIEGKGLFRFPDGTIYVGEFKNGIFDGRGTYRWPDGKTHEGEFKNNLPNGQGVEKDASGNVLSQGEFRDGQLVASTTGLSTTARGKLTGFLGIAWGTEQQEAEKIILARPETKWFGDKQYNQFIGRFANQAGILSLAYKDGKFVSGAAWLAADENEVLQLYEKMKSQFDNKYGKADQETGRLYDSKAQWDFPDDSNSGCIAINITKTSFSVEDQTLPVELRKPFAVVVHYVNGNDLAQQQEQQQNVDKDI